MRHLLSNKVAALATAISDRTDAAFGPDRSRSAAAALLTLAYWGPLTATELARIIGVSQPTLVRVAGGLIRDALVARRHKEGRAVALELTGRGRSEAKRLQRQRLGRVSKLLCSLSASDLQLLDALVDSLLEVITDGRATARRTCRFCAHDICDGPMCPVGSRATALEGKLDRSKR
jgi:DNA-binding MarR family transcriptional regulator